MTEKDCLRKIVIESTLKFPSDSGIEIFRENPVLSVNIQLAKRTYLARVDTRVEATL